MTNCQIPKVKIEYSPSPLVGEGGGEGEHTLFTPSSILRHQGGG